MAKNDLFCCLMQTDWRELIAPLIVFGIYAVVSILKSLASQPSQSEEEHPPKTPSTKDAVLREPQRTDLDRAALKQRQPYIHQTQQPAVPPPATAGQPPTSPKPRPIKSPYTGPTSTQSTKTKVRRAIPISRPTMPPSSAGGIAVVPSVMASASPVKPIGQPSLESTEKLAISPLATLIKDRHTLRRGIVLSEILGKPLALRRGEPFAGEV